MASLNPSSSSAYDLKEEIEGFGLKIVSTAILSILLQFSVTDESLWCLSGDCLTIQNNGKVYHVKLNLTKPKMLDALWILKLATNVSTHIRTVKRMRVFGDN